MSRGKRKVRGIYNHEMTRGGWVTYLHGRQGPGLLPTAGLVVHGDGEGASGVGGEGLPGETHQS